MWEYRQTGRSVPNDAVMEWLDPWRTDDERKSPLNPFANSRVQLKKNRSFLNGFIILSEKEINLVHQIPDWEQEQAREQEQVRERAREQERAHCPIKSIVCSY